MEPKTGLTATLNCSHSTWTSTVDPEKPSNRRNLCCANLLRLILVKQHGFARKTAGLFPRAPSLRKPSFVQRPFDQSLEIPMIGTIAVGRVPALTGFSVPLRLRPQIAAYSFPAEYNRDPIPADCRI